MIERWKKYLLKCACKRADIPGIPGHTSKYHETNIK